MQDPRIRDAIAAMGNALTPELLPRVQELFLPDQNALKARIDRAHADIPYGPHQRNRLDVYAPNAATPAPVLIWVHGGGFLRGDKYAPDNPYNAHIGRFAAMNGMVGVAINYRLAPDSAWPSGGEDVAAAIDWVRANIAKHGGDPGKIILAGASAGAAHSAHYLMLRPGREQIAGIILLSGLYGWTAFDERDRLYYGADPASDAQRLTKDAVAQTDTPMFVACAEFDPPRFQQETLGLLVARLASKGAMPRGFIANGHNHFSISAHIGASDTRLSDELLDFIRHATT
jgi:arylformamidase